MKTHFWFKTPLCHARGVTSPLCKGRKNGLTEIVVFCIFLLLFRNIALAVSFEATVDNTKIRTNQAVRLKLQLEGATSKGDPDLSGLEEYFSVYEAQKSKNYSYINGKRKSTEGWKIVIRPKMPGELIIPVIPLKTNQGMQYTQAINVYVDANVEAQDDSPVKIEGTPAKKEVFIKESFIYKINIFHENPIANANLDELEMPNCVIEKISQPKNGKTIINGKSFHTIEIKYLITPMKEGDIEIPPVLFKGEVQTTSVERDTFFDPFGNMRSFGNLGQFHEYEPFMVQTQKSSITVKPAISDISPWFALYNLQVKETWDGIENPKVGEPIIRTIILDAVGTTGQQLPDLKAEFEKASDIKVYSDNPEFTNEIDSKIDRLVSSRKEQFSIIPMKAGVITIPEIEITWWNLDENKKMVTKIPEKQIAVQENIFAKENVNNNNNNNDIQNNQNLKTKELNAQIKILYGIIVALIIILFGVIIFIIKFNKKEKNIKEGNNKSSLTNLNSINDINALREFICCYAFEKWNLQKNLALKEIPEKLNENNYIFDQELALELFTALDKSLYSREQGSLVELKLLWEKFSKSVVINKNKSNKNNTLDKLNPT